MGTATRCLRFYERGTATIAASCSANPLRRRCWRTKQVACRRLASKNNGSPMDIANVCALWTANWKTALLKGFIRTRCLNRGSAILAAAPCGSSCMFSSRSRRLLSTLQSAHGAAGEHVTYLSCHGLLSCRRWSQILMRVCVGRPCNKL